MFRGLLLLVVVVVVWAHYRKGKNKNNIWKKKQNPMKSNGHRRVYFQSSGTRGARGFFHLFCLIRLFCRPREQNIPLKLNLLLTNQTDANRGPVGITGSNKDYC